MWCPTRLTIALLLLRSVDARLKKPSKYPFNQLVAFGDQLSDNGNGSFAHGLDDGNIYGYHTWTDGPVAVSYLADLLGVPLLDFAWGGADGGGLAGSTIDNTYTVAKDTWHGKPVPSSADQINDYTSNYKSTIKNSLQFMWIGQNDLKKHTTWFDADPKDISPTEKINVNFYNDFTALLLDQVEGLIKKGAPAVVVVNFYPIWIAPITTYFLCKQDDVCSNNWAKVIEAGNDHMESALADSDYADQIIYYDIYGFMMKVINNKDSYGYTEPITNFCDGNHSLPTNKWDQCNQDKWASARPFFWFTNDQPETTVHQLIAKDIKKTVDAFYQ